MIKNLILSASTSFIAILLIANSAIAITAIDNSLAQTKQSALDLNIISPSLQLISNSNPSNHFGCSCLSCIQSTQTTTI